MTNYERLCSGVAEMADFILLHTTCFLCPAADDCKSGFVAVKDCEETITEWLLEESEGE